MKNRLAVVLATGFGLGFVPRAPGTAGSVLGAVLAWALHLAGGWLAVAIGTAVLLPVSIWASIRAESHYGQHDCQRIVIDEVVGQMVTLLPTPCDPISLLLGFALFRLFDSVKPFPAGWIDRNMEGGLGVVLDDVAAGVQAAAATAILIYAGPVTWVLARLHG